MRWLDSIYGHNSMDMSLSKLRERVKDREASCAAAVHWSESDMTEPMNKKINVPLKGNLLFCVYTQVTLVCSFNSDTYACMPAQQL